MVSLKKGEKVSLAKENKDGKLEVIKVALGWDTKTDLDSMAFLFDNDKKLKQTVYFGNKQVQGVKHHGDNLTGEGDGDDEIITVTLNQLPKWVSKISFAANIFAAKAKLWGVRDFSKVENSYIRILNARTRKEICRYDLKESGKGFNAFHFADLEKVNDEWIVNAVGEGMKGSVDAIGKKLEKKYKEK